MTVSSGADLPDGRALALRLSLFYGAYFVFIGLNLPFWPLWLTARGLDAGEIGAVMAAALWIRVAANPLLARMADRRGEMKRPLAAALLASAAIYGLYGWADDFWTILAVTLVGASLLSAVMPLGDSIALQASHAGHVQYGRVRLWGSVSFILAASGGGILLAGRPADWILLGLIASLVASFAASLALPDWRRPPGAAASGGLMTLLTDLRFVLFLAAASLVQASHSVLYGFGTLHWQAAGHGKATIGWLWAEGVIAEVLLFAAGAAVMRRIDGPRLLAYAGAAAALRWAAMALSTDLPVLVTVQVLHGLTFGAAHLAAMDFIVRAAPPGLAATAQGLYSAVALGAAFGITMLASGRLYAALGGGAFYVMAVLAVIGTLIAAGLARHVDQGKGVP